MGGGAVKDPPSGSWTHRLVVGGGAVKDLPSGSWGRGSKGPTVWSLGGGAVKDPPSGSWTHRLVVGGGAVKDPPSGSWTHRLVVGGGAVKNPYLDMCSVTTQQTRGLFRVCEGWAELDTGFRIGGGVPIAVMY